MGPNATQMERRGEASERGDINRDIRFRSMEHWRQLAEMHRDQAELLRQISVLESEIRLEQDFDQAARRGPAPPEPRRQRTAEEERKKQEGIARALHAADETGRQWAREQAAREQAGQAPPSPDPAPGPSQDWNRRAPPVNDNQPTRAEQRAAELRGARGQRRTPPRKGG